MNVTPLDGDAIRGLRREVGDRLSPRRGATRRGHDEAGQSPTNDHADLVLLFLHSGVVNAGEVVHAFHDA